MSDRRPHRPDLRVRVTWTPEREAQALRRLMAARAGRLRPRAYVLAGATLVAAAAVALLVTGVVPRGPGSTGDLTARERGTNVARGAGMVGPAAGTTGAAGPATTMAATTTEAPEPPGAERARESARRVQLRDGSVVVLEGTETVLDVTADEDRYVESQLLAGAARFQIAKRPDRVFRIHAGAATVTVLGTTFELDRRVGGDRVRLNVVEGRVKVAWSGGERQLTSGEAGTFPPRERARPPVGNRPNPGPKTRTAAATAEEPSPSASPSASPSSSASPPTSSWPSPSPPAPPAPSSPSLPPSPAAPPADHLATLLKIADDARAGGRSIDAAAALRAVAATSPADPRVPLAMFRLGRLLLEDLGQPREAAEAFARARSLAPHGPLAPDALAREVDARAAGGERARARALAREYLSSYPTGSQAAWVRRWAAPE